MKKENDGLLLESDIDTAETFEELTETLRTIKTIVRKDGKKCNTGDIIDLINDLRDSLERKTVDDMGAVLRTITRTDGLREKVIQLLTKEAVKKTSQKT